MSDIHCENTKQIVSVMPTYRGDDLILAVLNHPLSSHTTLSKKDARELADLLYELAGSNDEGQNPNQDSFAFAQEGVAA